MKILSLKIDKPHVTECPRGMVDIICVDELETKVLEKHVKFVSNEFDLIIINLYACNVIITHKVKNYL